MKTLANRNSDWKAAVAFAEAGEWDTAREMIPESRPRTVVSWAERMFAAIAFAEAGLHETAADLINGGTKTSRSASRTLRTVQAKGYA